jgi:hypothetical protein
MRISRSFTMLSLVLGAASLCSAATITYNVAQTVGAGSVTGFIETDGTLGVIPLTCGGVEGFCGIVQSHIILDFNLLFDDGVTTFDDNFSNSGFVVEGVALSATATQLLFNFDQPGLVEVAFRNLGIAPLLCINGSIDCGTGFDARDEFLSLTQDSISTAGHDGVTSLSGTQVIADIGTPTSTPAASAPEPSTLGLLVAGIALLGFRKFRWLEAASRV